MRRLAVFFVVALAVGCGTSNSPTDDKTESSSNPTIKVRQVSGAQSPDKGDVHYRGKPTNVWAKQLRDKDVATRIEAAKALEAIGPAAKSAVADLKVALKERAWELLIAHGGTNANKTFTTVGRVIGSTPPKEPSKDEIIAQLRRDLVQKDREIAEQNARHRNQLEGLFRDPCLQALVTSLLAIDRRELEAMVGPAVTTTTTFKSVGTTIGK